jgi:periplasmic protein TonB
MKKLLLIATFIFVVQFSFAQTEPEPEVFTIVETMPSWKGCEVNKTEEEKMDCTAESINKFINENFIYPENSKQDKIEGIIYIGFTIDEKGNIINPRVNRGISEELNAEAIRVIKLMPTWHPGANKGNPVPVVFTLPFNLSLNNSK